MAEEFDINEEYEKIFGKERRENLFSLDDEEYRTIRQSIIDSQRMFNTRNKLPFEGIILLSYDEYQRKEVIKEFEKQGHRIFYIEKSEGQKCIVYAAAYFDVKASEFYVLRNSFCKNSAYYRRLVNRHKIKKCSDFEERDGLLYQKIDICYKSASLAASCFLGMKTDFRVWKDELGKSLDAYFEKYKVDDIDELEEMTFLDDSPSTICVHNVYNTVKRVNPNHIFHINNELVSKEDYRAKGCYFPASKHFMLKAGSTLSLECTLEYANTIEGRKREKFIKQFCIKDNIGYRLKSDQFVESPCIAADYVIGDFVDGWTLWKDDQGKNLKSFYC